jgi:SAM-dependent methyltransferase
MSQPQPIRSKPEDYWHSPSFVKRYVGNAVVTTNDNLGCKMYFGACMAAIGQGIQYMCPQPQSLLYAGCGHSIKGSVMQKHFGCPVTGIDYSELMLAEAEKLQRSMPEEHKTRLLKMDVESLDFPDNMFDVTFCYGLLMSLPDPTKAIAEIMRVSRHGLVSIEETDAVMDDEQRTYWQDVKEKRYPGRVFWHDYIRLFRDCMQLVVTPMPIPGEWDMGAPPAYIRLIAVKMPMPGVEGVH